jgi:hypothetical protein
LANRWLVLAGMALLLSCNQAPTGGVSIAAFTAQPNPAVLPAEVELSWQLYNPLLQEVACLIDAEGDGASDYEISPCENTGSLFHTYEQVGKATPRLWIVTPQGSRVQAQVNLELRTAPSIVYLDRQAVPQQPLQQEITWQIEDADTSPANLVCTLTSSPQVSVPLILQPCPLEGSQLLTYGVPGVYQLLFRVVDNHGLYDEQSLQLGVGVDLPPQIMQFVADPALGTAPLVVTFNWLLSDPEGQLLSCRWHDGQGGSQVIEPCPSRGSRQQVYSLPGLYTSTLEVTDAAGQKVVREAAVEVRALQREPFNIQLQWAPGVPQAYQTIFTKAAQHWEQVIAQGLPEVEGPIPTQACRGGNLPFEGPIDDLVIEIRTPNIDGPGEILGSAGPCMIRRDGLPFFGLIRLDLADLAPLYEEGAMEYLVFHEMGHVLGFASLWNVGNRWLQGAGGANPLFVGPAAMQAYGELGGSGGVPVENVGPPGTRDAHWRESVFANEIMTGYLNQGDNLLGKVTIASLADLGYQVSYAVADPIQLPAPASPTLWLREPWHQVLRPQWVGPWPSQPLEDWLRQQP